jgi:hypothetical protein
VIGGKLCQLKTNQEEIKMTKPTYSIEPELVKPFWGKSRVVYNLIKHYDVECDTRNSRGYYYRTAKKVIDTYKTKWEAEDVMKLLNDLVGECNALD